MSELVDENGSLINYDDGLLGFRIEGDLEKTTIGDNFALDDIEESFHVFTSDVVIPRMTVGELQFAPAIFIDDANDTFGQSRTVARVPVNDIGGTVHNDAGALSAVISSGTLRFSFSNSLPVAIEISEIRLDDFGSGAVKLRHSTSMIVAADTQAHLDIDISNTTISSADYWAVSGYCAGSGGESVIINPEDSFDIQIELLDVTTETLSAPADYFNVEQKDSVIIGEAVCIRRASFSTGALTFDINNKFSFALNIVIHSPQFINRVTNTPLRVEIIASSGRITSKSIPIEDYTIEYQGELQRPQCVELVVAVQGDDKSGRINMQRHDSIDFTFGMRGVIIDHFTGRLDRFDVGIRPAEHPVALPDNMGQLSGLYLEDARLVLDFFNTLEMPIELIGVLVGKAQDGKRQNLDIEANIEPGTFSAEESTQVTYEATENADVARFASLLPRTIAFDGHAYVGEGVLEGSLSSESYIRAHYFLETPAFFSWNESNFVPDTTCFQVNPGGYKGPKIHPDAIELDADEVNTLEAFSLLAKIENHLPVSGSIEFKIYDETRQSAERVLSLTPVSIQTAELDELGLVTSSWHDSLVIKLNKQDVDIFQNEGDRPKLIKLVTEMKLHSTDGKRVKVYDSDFLVIQAVAQLIVGINKDK